jgi:hypothetical protein
MLAYAHHACSIHQDTIVFSDARTEHNVHTYSACVRVWSLSMATCVGTVKGFAGVNSMALNGKDEILAVCTRDNKVRVLGTPESATAMENQKADRESSFIKHGGELWCGCMCARIKRGCELWCCICVRTAISAKCLQRARHTRTHTHTHTHKHTQTHTHACAGRSTL